ncbi:MAG: hypothetical protein HDQ94_05535 [Desulfovibrio sp.]|nr:hypothetical protein [Desulfovibrio sp.]
MFQQGNKNLLRNIKNQLQECSFLGLVGGRLHLFSTVVSTPDPELPEGIHHIPDFPFTTWVYSHPDGHMAETPEMAKVLLKLLRAK